MNSSPADATAVDAARELLSQAQRTFEAARDAHLEQPASAERLAVYLKALVRLDRLRGTLSSVSGGGQ